MKKLMILLLVLYFTACQSKLDDDLSSLQELKSASLSNNGKAETYDKFIVKFAKSLSKSLDDESFRELIKEDAMKQEDGDYDIIWKTFKNKLHGKNSKTVGQTISENIEGSKSDENFIEMESFSAEFKKLQISVPVNCDKWNPSDHRPIVAYMLSNYDDETEFINAFDENGKKITLNTKESPDFPVIVVGLNERCDESGEIKAEFEMLKSAIIGDPIPPAPPTNLTASTVPSGIYLSWTKPMVSTGVTGYVIERKGSTELNFIATCYTTGSFNTVYTDIDVTPLETYSYRVKSWNRVEELESEGSTNIASATAPNSPKSPSAFTVQHVVQGESKLNWTNYNNQFITENRVYRYSHTAGSTYELIASLPPSSCYYFDRNVAPGRYDYMITHVNNQEESSGVIDFVHIPYRNIQGTNPIYIKNISFTDWDLERWPAGKPEFRINVLNVNKSDFKTFPVVSNVDFDFSSTTRTCNFNNRLLLNWSQDIWYDVLSIYMVEYDEKWGTFNVDISAGYKSKKDDEAGFNFNIGASYKLDLTDDHEDCGTIYVDFYEQPEMTYYFSNYGATITISNNP